MIDMGSAMRSLLAEGLVDYPNESYVLTVAGTLGGRAHEAKPAALELIRRMLESGDFVAGDLTGTGFERWPGAVSDWMRRIHEDWATRGEEVPTPGSIVWFDMTETGQAAARAGTSYERSREQS